MKSVLVVVLVSLTAAAEDDLSVCTDEFSDCHDNCSLRFGTSTKDAERLKLSKCMAKCQGAEQACRDRFLETKVHQLDEGALKNADRHDDDLREDNRKKPVFDDGPPQKVSTSTRTTADDAPTAKKAQPKEEELPKRTTTRLSDLEPQKKAEPKAEPKPEPKPEPIAERKSDPAPKKDAPLDSSVRDEDEKQKSSSSSSSKRADPAPESGRKKQRALDEWDPEAIEGR